MAIGFGLSVFGSRGEAPFEDMAPETVSRPFCAVSNTKNQNLAQVPSVARIVSDAERSDKMALDPKDVLESYFPTDKRVRYEYILQKAKKVLADQQLVVRVSAIRPGPGTTNQENFPSTIVELELLGIPYEHPITKRPIISRERLGEFFEGTEMQRGLVKLVCQEVGSTVPDDPELQNLKRKLETVTEGRPSALPPRLDLRLLYYELTAQVEITRQKLSKILVGKPIVDGLIKKFVAEAPADFWWLHLLVTKQLTIEALMMGSAEAVSVMILALAFDVSEEAIRSRLFRPE